MGDPHGREPSPYRIESPEHALRVGMVAGIAARHGVHVHEEYDEDGNYAASMLIFDGPPGLIRIVVPAPKQGGGGD